MKCNLRFLTRYNRLIDEKNIVKKNKNKIMKGEIQLAPFSSKKAKKIMKGGI
jgi:hypothetical protein